MLKLGSLGIGEMCIGSDKVVKAFLGSDLVYEEQGGAVPGIEAEYIETSGGAYLNTGIIQNSVKYELTLVMQWTGSTNNQFESFFAYMASSTAPRSGLHKYQGNWMFGTNTTNQTSVAVDNNKHTFFISDNGASNGQIITIDGTSAYSPSTSQYTGISSNTIPFFLGCRNKNGSIDNPSSAKFYSLNYKVFSDNAHSTLVEEYNFVPRYKDGVYGMYDTISQTFISSVSGTEFTGQLKTT